MAVVPISGTNVRLLSGVPFSNDYKNTRWFDTVTEQTNYFLARTLVHSIANSNFQRIEGKNYVKVNASIDQLHSVNYLMFQNAEYNLKWFYAFVTKLEYIQKNVTYVYFQIDVLQTWKFDMNFKPSFVIREHCPLWNTDGSPVINTVDEGLNYGTEYDNVSVQKITPYGGYKWLVIVCKEQIHNGSTLKPVPTRIGSPQPLSVYLSPFNDSDNVPNVVLPSGMGVLVSKPTEILNHIYKDVDAVGNVVSIFVTDFPGLQGTYDEASNTFTFAGIYDIEEAQISDGQATPTFFNTLYVADVGKFAMLSIALDGKYDGYKTVTESKLLMYPYTQLVLDDFKGNRVIYKNEYINENPLFLNVKGSLGINNKVSYSIENYNIDATSLDPDIYKQIQDEFALINADPNDLSVINDMLAAFIQGNRNSIQNQKNSIMWNGAWNTVGAGVGMVASGMAGNIAGSISSATSMIQGAGNTALQLQGIEAKQKDIDNMPPQIAKMGSNTSYSLGNEHNGVYVIKKQIKQEYINKLEHFFNMFGYKVNEVKIPNFHTRQNWNYVHTASCNITGNFNNEDLNELKAVFDNGITLWHTNDVGNYELANGVI